MMLPTIAYPRAIKQLSEETKQSAQEIEEMIQAVQNHSEQTVSEIEAMVEVTDDGVETVQETITAFENTAANVIDMNENIQQVNHAAGEQADLAEDVALKTQNVSDISDQNSHEIQNVAAATEQQAATLHEFASNTTSLSDNAAELMRSLNEFSLRDGQANTPQTNAPHDTQAEAVGDD